MDIRSLAIRSCDFLIIQCILNKAQNVKFAAVISFWCVVFSKYIILLTMMEFQSYYMLKFNYKKPMDIRISFLYLLHLWVTNFLLQVFPLQFKF